MRRETSLLTRVLLYSILLTFTFMTLYPVFWLIVSSFKTTQEFQVNRLGLPRRWTCQNYPLAWKIGGFGHLFTNSIIYTVGSTAAVVLLSLSAGFAFAKIRSRATPFLHGSFVIGILLSVEAVLIPLFLMANTAGLTDTRLGILLPYIGMGMPKGIYLCTEYIKSIPDSLVESARIDGASYPKILASIIAPMAKPVATTLAILNVTGVERVHARQCPHIQDLAEVAAHRDSEVLARFPPTTASSLRPGRGDAAHADLLHDIPKSDH